MRTSLRRPSRSLWTALAAASLLPAALPRAAAQSAAPSESPATFAIRAGAIYPATAESPGPIENGILLVRDGRIVAAGANVVVPDDVPLIDLPDAVLMPGMVSAASPLAGRHRGPETAAGDYRAIDAFDTYGRYSLQLARGVTAAHIDPGDHRLIAGVGAMVKLAGPPASRTLQSDASIAVNFGVFGPPRLIEVPFYASSDVGIPPAVRQAPSSRIGQLLEVSRRLAEAEQAGDRAPRDEFGQFDAQRLALARVWKQGLPLRIQARSAADVEAAVALAARYKRPAYLVGAAQGARHAAALRAAGLPVVFCVDAPYDRSAEDLGPDPAALADELEALGELVRAAPELPIALAGRNDDYRLNLRLIAALAVRGGMSPAQALAAITRVPAEILGVNERIGSLAPGKDADFLVLSGQPLDVQAAVLRTYVGGRLVYEAPAAPSRSLVVRAGRIWVGDGRIVQDGQILIEDGQIRSVGARVAVPGGARILDAGPGAFVTPGFIDAHGHLGLEGDSATVTPELPIHTAIGAAGVDFLRVARAGVTTVMLSAYNSAGNGSRVAAIKTWGRARGEMLVRETAGLKFSLRGKDPLDAAEALRRVMESGRKYEESWKKYEADLKKWEDDKKKGVTEKPKEETETKVEAEKADPITGTWDVTVSGGPMPEPISVTIKLRLTGTKIEGRLGAPGTDEEVVLTGELDGNTVILEVDQDTPIGKPTIRATLDRDDHMTGKLTIGEFALDFEATRVDKAPVEFKVTRSRKRRGGKPLPPKVEPALEPLRMLLAGKAPAVVEVETAAQINAALKLFVDDFKVPVVLVDADEAADVAAQIHERKDNVGVVVPVDVLRRRDRVAYNPAADLSRRGIAIAMQSGGEDGARNLPLRALFAVQEGLGGDAALRALTIDAARMFRIDDRIGTIEAGKEGDLLIHSGHPFDPTSRLEHVIVGGREVPADMRDEAP